MLLGTSILKIDYERMNELYASDTDFIHVDVMDGEFVPETTSLFYVVKERLKNNNKPLDVHLMVKDVKKYSLEYGELSPEYITFHYEAVKEHLEYIQYIKKLGVKVGLAINPGTPVDSILSFLDCVDMVLIMSVQPGKGGQKFLDGTLSKIKRLKFIRDINNLNFKIEVDGGVTDENVQKLENVDLVICGTNITSSSDFNKQIHTIKYNFPLREFEN